MAHDPRRRAKADASAWADRLERWLATYRAHVDSLVDEAPAALRRVVRLIRQPKVIEAAVAIALVILGGRAVRLALRPESRAWFKTVTGEESIVEGVKGIGALAWLQLTGPTLALAPDAPIDHLSTSPFGANTFLQLEADEQVVKRSFERMRAAGIGWARQQFPWEDIEIHARGDFEDRRNDPPRSAWDKYDRIVYWADNYGIDLLVRLDNPPDWAYADLAAEGEARMGPPSDLTDYTNFVKAVAGRYCGRIRHYQLWNEPNIYPEWGERPPDPAGYARLLHTAAAAARSVCSDVVIVSAALAPTTRADDRNMSDLAFLEALYTLETAAPAGGEAAPPDGYFEEGFDILGAQGFGLWTGPTDRRVSPDRTNFSRVLLLRDIMVRHGDEATPIWLTEFGWDSPPETTADGQLFPAPYGRVDEDRRAEYTRDAYDRIQDEWPFVGVACVWFLRRPDREWHSRPEGWFRLIEPEWDELPAYGAIKEMARRPPRVMRGRHAVDDPNLLFSGPWRTPSDTDLGLATRLGSASAELNFSFRGTGWQLVLDPYARGHAPLDDEAGGPDDIAGDDGAGGDGGDPAGARVATAPPSAGSPVTATVAVTTAASGPITLFVFRDSVTRTVTLAPGEAAFGEDDLAHGDHTVILRVDGGELPLDEVRILAPDPPDPLWPIKRALLRWALYLGAAAAAVWAFRRWRARARPAAVAHTP